MEAIAENITIKEIKTLIQGLSRRGEGQSHSSGHSHSHQSWAPAASTAIQREPDDSMQEDESYYNGKEHSQSAYPQSGGGQGDVNPFGM